MVVNKAQAEASRLLKKYSISRPSLDDLIQIAGANGYEIIDYSLSNNPTNVTTLLHELSLEQLAATRRAFVFKRGEIRLLFVCDSMTSSEKRYAIAHELGHIVMGHLKNGLCNDAEIEEEYEANEFAHYLLRPGFAARGAVWVRRHQAISILIVVFVALGIAAIPVTAMILKEQSYYGEYYITENGEKYHDKKCTIIKGKANVRRLTKEDYESGKYQPCQICLHDHK